MTSFSIDKQRGKVNAEWMSRPVDSYKNQTTHQPPVLALTSMAQSPTFAYRLKRKLLSGSILGVAYIIPFFIRSFIVLFDKKGTIDFWLNAVDFITFGLVLNLTNITELEGKTLKDKNWKTRNIGLSIVQIIIFSSIFAILTYSEFKKNIDLDIDTVKMCSIVLAFAAFVFSYSIYNRLNSLSK